MTVDGSEAMIASAFSPPRRGSRRRDHPPVTLAVVAAHRTGLPLHGELLDLGSTPAGIAHTAPVYRLVALPGPGVARGGLVPAPDGGARIEVELHRLPVAGLGVLLCGLPAPLAIGRVSLETGSTLGLVCAGAPPGALDVSAFGSWPAYLAHLAVPLP